MQSDSRTRKKQSILVQIALIDGSILVGKLFVSPHERLLDVLNGDRDFLPVETKEGAFLAVAKTAIKQITLPATEAPAYLGNDPYAILGVRQGVSPEELKKAYHQLCFVNHPDRIKGFGLGADYQELATHKMARLSNAYAQISRTMKVAEGKGAGADRVQAAGVRN